MESLLSRLDLKTSPWLVIILTSVLLLIGEVLFVLGIWHNPDFQDVVLLRNAHIAIIAIVFIVTLLQKHKWSKYHGPVLYFCLLAPLLVVAWYNQVTIAATYSAIKPFSGFQPIFLLLAVLVAGSYLLNFLLMVAFAIEIVVLWVVFKPYYSKNPQLSEEPYGILLFTLVSFCLLLFRYHEERTHRVLMKKQARHEFIENLAHTFLSLRDRSNTPLQALYFLVEIFKRKRSVSDEDIEILEKSVVRLNELNRKIIRYESHISWSKDLMTEDEIDHWLNELELELHR